MAQNVSHKVRRIAEHFKTVQAAHAAGDHSTCDPRSDCRQTSEQDEKVRENRLRRMAARQGLRLNKSRSRDPRAIDYGTFGLSDAAANYLVTGSTSTGFGLSLDEVETALTS